MRAISQIRRLVAALEEVMDPQIIGPWLNSPNESFDGSKPLEVIERGQIDRIWQMIYELRSGGGPSEAEFILRSGITCRRVRGEPESSETVNIDQIRVRSYVGVLGKGFEQNVA
ncbi:hypothetical protein [Planctomicrobium sp. SH664]|uniref:hypothetical protein n=1 Tax=Planctomicrobium sp. SH664 TaxID=3448125 RepID=UPI003F5BE258